ncbi:MAG TPA: TIGR02680 family protein, partial [Cellulomonas sp.]
DELLIAELAEGFERLDQQRAQLVALRDQERAATDLSTAARNYARVAIRDRATALSQATTALDKASADLRHGESRLAAAHARAAETSALVEQHEGSLRELGEGRAALRRSDAYQEGRNLDDLRSRAADARRTADRSAGDLASAAQAVSTAETHEAQQLSTTHHARDGLVELLRTADDGARGLGLMPPGDAGCPPPPLLGSADVPTAAATDLDRWGEAIAATLSELGSRARVRRGQAHDVIALATAHEAAVAHRERTEGAVARAADERGSARTELTQAQHRHRESLDARVRDVAAWSAALTELSIDPVSLTDALDRLTATDGSVDELPALVGAAERGLSDQVLALRAALEIREHELRARQGDARAEIARLETVGSVAPRRATWRDGPPSTGAPLWRLIDARDGVDPATVAGVEAALESSGLLDAWVRPDGDIRIEGHDLLLGGTLDARPGEATLGDVLTIDGEQSEVPADVVRAVLRSVALVDAGGTPPDRSAWMGADGRWRLGPLHGRWTKPDAQYVGATARERHRRAQHAELTALVARLDAELADVAERAEALTARLATARHEVAALPTAVEVSRTAREVDHATVRLSTRDADHAACLAERAEAEAATTRHRAALEAAAAQAALPQDRAALTELATGLTELASDVTGLDREARSYVGTARGLRHAQQQTSAARAHESDAAGRARADELAARALEVELVELDGTRGAEYRDVVTRIDAITADIGRLERELPGSKAAAATAASAVATLTERLDRAASDHTLALADRDRTQDLLGLVLRTSLADDADLDLPADSGEPDRVKASLELARGLLRRLSGDRATRLTAATALSERAHRVASALADRAQIDLDSSDPDLLVPTAVHGSRRTSIRALVATIRAERERTATEITDGEHQLFRRILAGDTRRHLAGRIREAQDLIDGMNRRLQTVRTASEVQVRLRWEVRDDDGELVQQARRLLMTNPARLTDADEVALERFLDDRIARARAADDALPWAQQLARVFDYTAWHQFRVQLTRNDGADWQTLTRRVHSALSGGEKAIALHLPLFAALAAHYEATPGAPRLILLDEVFVGIDTANRGQIFGLLRDLDLDLVLTSDHEWGAYPQVDGLAIHALTAGTDDDAVTSTRFVWTGTELVEDPLDDGRLL